MPRASCLTDANLAESAAAWRCALLRGERRAARLGLHRLAVAAGQLLAWPGRELASKIAFSCRWSDPRACIGDRGLLLPLRRERARSPRPFGDLRAPIRRVRQVAACRAMSPSSRDRTSPPPRSASLALCAGPRGPEPRQPRSCCAVLVETLRAAVSSSARRRCRGAAGAGERERSTPVFEHGRGFHGSSLLGPAFVRSLRVRPIDPPCPAPVRRALFTRERDQARRRPWRISRLSAPCCRSPPSPLWLGRAAPRRT